MIEEIILNYLRESSFSCYLSVPEEPSGNFVVLDKTGSCTTWWLSWAALNLLFP